MRAKHYAHLADKTLALVTTPAPKDAFLCLGLCVQGGDCLVPRGAGERHSGALGEATCTDSAWLALCTRARASTSYDAKTSLANLVSGNT